MTKDMKMLMLTAARSVLAEAEAGRNVDPHRLQWAKDILAGCETRTEVLS